MQSTGNIKRRITVPVSIGGIPLGSEYPVRIQSMANTLTSDVPASVAQCKRISDAGGEYVRFTVPSLSDVDAFAEIKRQLRKSLYMTPLIADVHFNPEIALKIAVHADKVRINPGNFRDVSRFTDLIRICRQNNIPIRIGVNHGSLSEKIMDLYGDTPRGMAESAMEFLRICKSEQFNQVVVSMKASNVRVMVYATRLIAHMMDQEGLNYPLHLGVTEAGEGEDGRTKSAVGIGTLLAEGIGDTIRVSLTEEPEAEIPVARKIVAIADCEKDRVGERESGRMGEKSGRFEYARRQSRTVENIGGNQVPVVWGVDNISRNIKLTEADNSNIDELLKAGDRRNEAFIYNPSLSMVHHELSALRDKFDKVKCDTPVIFRLHLKEPDRETFLLKAASFLGGSFIDGFGDGIWLSGDSIDPQFINSVSLGILQACRARMSKTEYISCPSCGRTQFNLMEAVAKIKLATSHLKGLKIGVMGCIVNGPGEMADADYGYVGSGKGTITLYKARQVVKRGIPQENAVDELISLIKYDGLWINP